VNLEVGDTLYRYEDDIAGTGYRLATYRVEALTPKTALLRQDLDGFWSIRTQRMHKHARRPFAYGTLSAAGAAYALRKCAQLRIVEAQMWRIRTLRNDAIKAFMPADFDADHGGLLRGWSID